MEKKNKEFHFGDWTSSSEEDSQGNYDSDTICPISLNDLINIEKKSQKQKQDEDIDFIIPSLADSIDNNNNQEDKSNNKDNTLSRILYDFTQNSTVLGFNSSFSSNNGENNEEKIEYTTKSFNNCNIIDDNDEKLKSFTSLVQNEQTFVQLHQKCFSSSSDSDIFVVTNNEEVLEPDSDSSTENTFEDYQLSQMKQTKSQTYDSKEQNNDSKSLTHTNKNENESQINLNEEDNQTEILKDESPQTNKIINNNIVKKSLNKSNNFLLKESKILNSSSQKRITLKLTSSDSSSSINLDLDKKDDQNKFKNTNTKKSPNRNINIALVNRKRHLNTLNSFNLNDYSSTSSYSYSDDENQKDQLSSNFFDSLDSTVTIKNTSKTQKEQVQQKIDKNKKEQNQIENNQNLPKHENNQNKLKNDKDQKQVNKQIQIDNKQTQQKIENKQKNDKNEQKQESKQIQIENKQKEQRNNNNNEQKQENNQIQIDNKQKIDQNEQKQENEQKEQKIDKNDQKQMKEKLENNQEEQQENSSNQLQHHTNHSTTTTTTQSNSPNKIISLQKIEFNDTIVYPKPKKKNAKNSVNKSNDQELPNLYPVIPPIILSPIKPNEKTNKENLSDKEFNSDKQINQISIQNNESQDPLILSESSQNNSMYEIESPLKKSDKKPKITDKSENSSVLKTGSFSHKKKSHLSDISYESDSEKWVDDDPINPSESNESIISLKETEKEKIEKKTEIDSKNLKEKINQTNEQYLNKNQTNDSVFNMNQLNNQHLDKNKSNVPVFDMNQINIPVFSFYEFISELPQFNDLNSISIVLTINGLFNLPPPSGVSQLDLVLHFQNLRCTPIIINLKSARFRTGKYDATENQVLIRVPLLPPRLLPRPFINTENSSTIGNIDELYNRRKNENENENGSKTNLIEINGSDSKKLVLTFELMGNGKRICGSNLCLIEEEDEKVSIAQFGKHFLRLMLRPNMKCELKKGEKEALIELQINKVDDRDENQMKNLPFFSIIHVFFVDSVIAYRQVLERYTIQKVNDKINDQEFNLLSFFSAASSDVASMKKFAKSFKDAMKKLPKDKRGYDDKLNLFVNILRGSVFQELTNSKFKYNQKGMLPFSTIEISVLNS